jgi:3-hydroxyacyl-CoA dehydrogenase
MFFPYCLASNFLVQNGVNPYRIDFIMKNSFKMPMGPFRLYDLTGVDIMQKGKFFI